jgi:hypothetical protein
MAYLIDLPWTERMGPLQVLPRVVCAPACHVSAAFVIDETRAWGGAHQEVIQSNQHQHTHTTSTYSYSQKLSEIIKVSVS